MSADIAIAHAGQGGGAPHRLDEHLQAVAALAARHLHHDPSARELVRLAGLWHDLGKYRPGFQKYVQLADNPDAHIEGKVIGREKTHSAAGALWAMQRLEQTHGAPGKLAARVLAYLIAGQHSRK